MTTTTEPKRLTGRPKGGERLTDMKRIVVRMGKERRPESYTVEEQHGQLIRLWAADHCGGNKSQALRQMIDTAAMSSERGQAAVVAERDRLAGQLAEAERKLAALGELRQVLDRMNG